jgi:hypothetical protein
MKAFDRALFVLCEYASGTYENHPLPVGFDVTFSAPHMHAMMLDLMAPRGCCRTAAGRGDIDEAAHTQRVVDHSSPRWLVTVIVHVRLR